MLPGQNRSAIMLAAILIVGLCAAAWQAQDEPEVIKLEGGTTLRELALEDSAWLVIDHESGAEYVLRESAIIGFATPQPGSAISRNSIMLNGGFQIHTDITAMEFAGVLQQYVVD